MSRQGQQPEPPKPEIRTGEMLGPRCLEVPFDGRTYPSVFGSELTVNVYEDGRCRFGYIAIRCGDTATHIAAPAEELRHVAAHLAKTADLIDGGRGKQ